MITNSAIRDLYTDKAVLDTTTEQNNNFSMVELIGPTPSGINPTRVDFYNRARHQITMNDPINTVTGTNFGYEGAHDGTDTNFNTPNSTLIAA